MTVNESKVAKEKSKSKVKKTSKISFPTGKETSENKKTFSFVLEPQAKENIDRKAKEQGYRNASRFLNDFFMDLY